MGERLLAVLATISVTYIILQATFLYLAFHASRVVNLVTHVIVLLLTYRLSSRYFRDKKINSMNKAVLITGCDSGFGNQLAKRLDSKGFRVFASCLFPEGKGANDLKQTCSNRLKVLPLDVANDDSVADALEFVKRYLGSNDLWAVVNNAGVSEGSAVEFSTMKHFKDTIEVNAMGPVRVTKAFLPLIKMSKGRVVNVSSVLGRIPAPHMCPYVMSKHALIAFSECLSLEMIPWGVRVISIEPETFRTPITEIQANICRLKAEMEEIDESIISSYGKEYFEQRETLIRTTIEKSSSRKTDIVVDAMETALTKEHPDHVYKPRWSWPTKVLCIILENAPFSIFEKFFLVFAKVSRYPVPSDTKLS